MQLITRPFKSRTDDLDLDCKTTGVENSIWVLGRRHEGGEHENVRPF